MEKRIPNVLVVDDDFMSCKIVTLMIKQSGYDVKFVESGKAATEIMQKIRFDLVVLDWIMPAPSGEHFITLVRSGAFGDHHRAIPIVVITADLIRCTRKICVQAGATDYLTKPTRLTDLVTVLQNCLNPPD